MEDLENLPRLCKMGSTWQLIVDGKPFLILGGQVQNSSMNSADYMRPLWKKLVGMGINTVLGPVAWEDIEPEENIFDFTELETILTDARSYGMRIVLLWFGSFKNGMSTYVPPWVKKDSTRFPRVQIRTSDDVLKTIEVLTVFDRRCVDADAKAFAMLMRRLKEVDTHRTVIMVQVENESGILGDARDRSPAAEAVFRAPVPQQLAQFLADKWKSPNIAFTPNHTSFDPGLMGDAGDWDQCFGESAQTDELFMAYHYALYLDKIAAAGKREYPLPLYINAWLPKPDDTPQTEGLAAGGHKPGIYPSGGATSNVLHIWKMFAPSVDFISPDIYTTDYTETCAIYAGPDKPFFIPEQRRDAFGARRICQAIGSFGAIGVSPFAVDTLQEEDCAFAPLYKLLQSVSGAILAAQTNPDSIWGFFFDDFALNTPDPSPSFKKQFGEYELKVSRAFVLGHPGPGTGIILHRGPGNFMIIGMGFKVQFDSLSPTSQFTGILTCTEKSVLDAYQGTFKTLRKLNGDETKGGSWCNMPNETPDYGDQFIPMCIPAGTMITEVQVYSLQ